MVNYLGQLNKYVKETLHNDKATKDDRSTLVGTVRHKVLSYYERLSYYVM